MVDTPPGRWSGRGSRRESHRGSGNGPDKARQGDASSASGQHARGELRELLRAQRAALGSDTQAAASARVMNNCLPLLQHASTIAGYLAVGGEMDISLLLQACRERNQQTLLPVLDDKQLRFAHFDQDTKLEPNRFRINEPAVALNACLAPMDIDIILLPLVGFDRHGNRLGMGGGFYDRSLADRRTRSAPPLLVGIAHGFQQVDSIPTDWWDVPLDVIVTDARVVQTT